MLKLTSQSDSSAMAQSCFLKNLNAICAILVFKLFCQSIGYSNYHCIMVNFSFYNAVLCNSLKVPRKKSVRVRYLDFLLDDFCNLRPSRKRLLEAGLLHAVLVQPAIRTDYRVRRGKLARRRVWFDSASTASGFPHVGVLVRGQHGQT